MDDGLDGRKRRKMLDGSANLSRVPFVADTGRRAFSPDGAREGR